jgi:integrase-like protein
VEPLPLGGRVPRVGDPLQRFAVERLAWDGRGQRGNRGPMIPRELVASLAVLAASAHHRGGPLVLGHAAPDRGLIFDRDSTLAAEVVSTLKSFDIKPARTAYRSPWQNGVAERWVGSVRRELLDHVVVFNERHLRRLLRDYVAYYHEDRTHLGLEKQTPAKRAPGEHRSPPGAVVALPRLGGLHHRYELAA